MRFFLKNAYFGTFFFGTGSVECSQCTYRHDWLNEMVQGLSVDSWILWKKRLDNLTIHNIFPTNAELAGCRSESQSGVDGDKFAITTGTIIIWWQRTYLRNVRHRKQLYETEQLIFLRKRANRANLNIRYRRFASYVSSRAGGDVVFDVFVPF